MRAVSKSVRSIRFDPPWWATVGMLVLGALFVAAGVWQLGRAGERRTLIAVFDAGRAAPPVAAPSAPDDAGSLRFRRIVATGRYDAAHQVLLDARMRQGRAGYEVLTPLVAGGRGVLVNRGWIEADPDRSRLPELGVDGAPRTVEGLLDHLPRAAVTLATSPAVAGPWPRRMLYPQSGDIGRALGYPVSDYQLLLAPGEADGFEREWRPALMSPTKHVGYAVQWFALAVALVVLYVWLNLRRQPGTPS